MKILLCHNYYVHPGGEDQSFNAEAWLLEAHGHEVIRFELDNDAIVDMSKLEVARRTIWNGDSYRRIRDLIRCERPDVMHCTNTFPLISPAAYYAARREGVAVVQSLRNYRLLCLNSYFLRDGVVCEDCLTRRVAWPGVKHGCYRDNRAASAVVAGLQTVHRALGTWRKMVDLYFTPSEFTRQKHLEAGFDPERIVVKPNFIHPDPGSGTGKGGYAIFVGRLSPEKGVAMLLEAWKSIGPRLPLKIVGDGPLAPQVAEAASASGGAVEFCGRRSPDEVLALVGEAKCLVMPSLWYETFGRTIVEAFAKGTPALVARLGAMSELVEEGRTGLKFDAGDSQSLIVCVQQFLDQADEGAAMRAAARACYLERYTAEPNYAMLMKIYQQALENAGRRSAARGRRLQVDALGRAAELQ